ncbi:MAG: hypothetical protein AVDCRST_MAG09-1998 [uncultured Sphingomonas sp.]|uniref:Uncharacterized protein n=1 Tax=uncultured Sphingomonas sp. TaxID=158754 RepID=A0A6J4TCZ4_9SPHN|nr:MAG: hypothetical protein AVDCRST_MAG09-1998 [uncultured Sphingomonas sp.]
MAGDRSFSICGNLFDVGLAEVQTVADDSASTYSSLSPSSPSMMTLPECSV